MSKSVLISLSALLMAGCSSYDVYKPAGDIAKGLPFYVKVPIGTQETLRATDHLLVQVKVTESIQADDKVTVLASRDLPAQPLTLPDSNAVRMQLEQLIDAVRPDQSYQATLDQLRTSVDSLAKSRSLPVDETTCKASRVAGNSWTMSTMAGTQPYYIVTKQPLIGTASSTFKFSDDGTMTEATASATDDTLKTVLSWFPITSKLTKQWGLAPADPKEGGASEYRSYGLDLGAPKPKQLRKVVSVDLTMSTASTIYTLRRVGVVGADSLETYLQRATERVPLDLCQALVGKEGVQLVSIAPAGGPPPADKAAEKGEEKKSTDKSKNGTGKSDANK